MSDPSLTRRRLRAQGLLTRRIEKPLTVVKAHGAMQGQDLPGVLASVAARTVSGSISEVLAALDDGQLVRGYPMRGTVFLTAAEDLAWLTDLFAAPAKKASERRRPQLGLTNAHLDQARELSLTATDSPLGVSRTELFAGWQRGGIPTANGCGYHLLSALIHEGLLCYGPWNGTDQNIVSSARWLPTGSTLAGRFNGDRIAAIGELLHRYLTSHGPATLRDFAWWTKAPLREVRAAALLLKDLETDGATEASWWRPGLDDETDTYDVLLLPGFDELILGYPDRLFAMAAAQHEQLVPGNNGIFRRSIIADDKVIGFWKTTGVKPRRLQTELFVRRTKKLDAALERAFASYGFITA